MLDEEAVGIRYYDDFSPEALKRLQTLPHPRREGYLLHPSLDVSPLDSPGVKVLEDSAHEGRPTSLPGHGADGGGDLRQVLDGHVRVLVHNGVVKVEGYQEDRVGGGGGHGLKGRNIWVSCCGSPSPH